MNLLWLLSVFLSISYALFIQYFLSCLDSKEKNMFPVEVVTANAQCTSVAICVKRLEWDVSSVATFLWTGLLLFYCSIWVILPCPQVFVNVQMSAFISVVDFDWIFFLTKIAALIWILYFLQVWYHCACYCYCVRVADKSNECCFLKLCLQCYRWVN